MQTEPKICFFLGANSPSGFYSLYDQLIDPAQARDILILKGGPGCGKSSLMRRVGQAAEERGYQVEYIVCSGDPDSLDGVVLPELRCAVVDGTSPHGSETKGHLRRTAAANPALPLPGTKNVPGVGRVHSRDVFCLRQSGIPPATPPEDPGDQIRNRTDPAARPPHF